MGMASLVTGLENWLYLKNELIEWTDFSLVVQIEESSKSIQWF